MKFAPLLFVLVACSQQEPSQKEAFTGRLKFLKQTRDSLTKIKTATQAKLFEQEITMPGQVPATDTARAFLQKSIAGLTDEIDKVERDIESTEAEIYKPH